MRRRRTPRASRRSTDTIDVKTKSSLRPCCRERASSYSRRTSPWNSVSNRSVPNAISSASSGSVPFSRLVYALMRSCMSMIARNRVCSSPLSVLSRIGTGDPGAAVGCEDACVLLPPRRRGRPRHVGFELGP